VALVIHEEEDHDDHDDHDEDEHEEHEEDLGYVNNSRFCC